MDYILSSKSKKSISGVPDDIVDFLHKESKTWFNENYSGLFYNYFSKDYESIWFYANKLRGNYFWKRLDRRLLFLLSDLFIIVQIPKISKVKLSRFGNFGHNSTQWTNNKLTSEYFLTQIKINLIQKRLLYCSCYFPERGCWLNIKV